MGVRNLIRLIMLLSSLSLAIGLIIPTQATAQPQEESLKYKVGERARQTIYAIETIRVADAVKRPEIISEIRKTIPPIYGYRKSSMTTQIQALEDDWIKTRETFLSEAEKVFGTRVLRNVETTSEAFSKFLSGFQIRNQGFPITDNTGKRWARGDEDREQLQLHITEFETFMTSYFIGSEKDLSSNEIEQVDLISISLLEPESLADLKNLPMSKLALSQLLEVSKAKELFQSESNTRNKPTRIYLSTFVRPNTEYMENLSIERWANADSNQKKETVFEKGEIVVYKGDIITPIIKEALDLMIIGLRFSRLKSSVKTELAKENEHTHSPKAPIESPLLAPQKQEIREPEDERPQGILPPLLGPTTVAQSNKASQPIGVSSPATSNANPSVISAFYLWLIGIGTMVLVSILVVEQSRFAAVKG